VTGSDVFKVLHFEDLDETYEQARVEHDRGEMNTKVKLKGSQVKSRIFAGNIRSREGLVSHSM